jgi:hypothetical protein
VELHEVGHYRSASQRFVVAVCVCVCVCVRACVCGIVFVCLCVCVRLLLECVADVTEWDSLMNVNQHRSASFVVVVCVCVCVCMCVSLCVGLCVGLCVFDCCLTRLSGAA